MFSDAIYSHYEYVKARLATFSYPKVGANGQPLSVTYGAGGLLMAQQWPPQNVKLDNTLYLLDLSALPIGRQGYSAANPIKIMNVQWAWIVKGTDLQAGTRGLNRGDRFVIHQQIQDAMNKALYPGFCEKKSWALDGNGNFVGTSLNPPEFILWNPVPTDGRPQKESGIIYGVAALRIVNMLDQITA